MAMEPVSVSLPRDNSLEELRVVIEEKKEEVKKKFAELKKLLEISENTATNRLDRIYTDVREGVERNERTVTQLEQAKIAVNSTLVDNDMNSLLQTTIQNFDDQIAKARNSACVVPKHISLRWSIEELKQSIENVCEVISTSTDETPVSTEQPNKYEAITQDLKYQISQLQNQLESKETETAILRASLYDSSEVLENIRLQLQQTQQTNPTKVQSRRDSQTGTVVKEKPAQYTQVVSKHKQQPKYTISKLSVKGKYSQFYALSQVVNPSELVGELVVCKAKWKSEYVIGTLKVVIPAKLKYEKAMEIAGIEFTDEFGDSSGSYRGISYFNTNFGCALFIPTTDVYISYNESPK